MDNNFNNNNNDNNFYQQPKDSYQNPYENNNYNNNYNNNNNRNNEPTEGTVSLVLGIISIVLCCSFPVSPALAVIAIIYANKCKSMMGGVDTSKSAIGRTCGIIGIVLSVLALLLYIAYYVICIVAAVTI